MKRSISPLKKIPELMLAILFILVGVPSLLMAELEIFGYYENRLFLLRNASLGLGETSKKFSLGDYNRLRLQLKSSPSEKISLNLAVDFFTYHGMIKSPLGVYGSEDETENRKMDINLDRAFIELYFPGFDLTVGKQRIAIGVSYLWAPLDLFNRVNIFEPREEKPGVNALKVYVPLGKFSSIMGVFVPEENFKSSKSGIRAQTHFKGMDIALNILHFGQKNQSVYGFDVRGENVIGWWVEGGYFSSPGTRDMKVVVGFDYTFPLKRGIYWLNEFFFDESGVDNIALYDYDKLLQGERFTLGRQYYFSSLSYPFADFLSLNAAYIGNWSDGSFILSPGLQYELAPNVSLRTGIFFLMGKKGGEFNREGASDILFIWIKMHF